MSEQNTNPEPGNGGDDRGTSRPHGGKRGRKARFAVAAAVLLGAGVLIGGLGSMALNAAAFGGHGFGHHGRGGEHGREHMLEHVQKKVAWMLAAVDATPEQTSKIEDIVADTVQRMASFRNEKHGARKEFMAELLQGEVNRDKLEQLRQRRLASIDQMSVVMLDGAVRAAEVLTPEQRQQIGEEALARHRFRH